MYSQQQSFDSSRWTVKDSATHIQVSIQPGWEVRGIHFFKFNFYWSIVALQCFVNLLYNFYCESTISTVNQPYICVGSPSYLGHHRAVSRFPELHSEVAQSRLTLRDPMDCTVHGILQSRILEWIAFPFSRGSFQPRNGTGVSCIAGGFFTNWAKREAWVIQ